MGLDTPRRNARDYKKSGGEIFAAAAKNSDEKPDGYLAAEARAAAAISSIT